MARFVVSCLLFVVSCLGCGDLETTVASLTVSPSTATVGVNQSKLFNVVVKDSVGQIVSATPTWSVTGGIGSITSTGIFIAGASAGSGAVVASYGSLSSSSTVTVTDKGWVEGRITDSKGNRVPSMKVYLKDTSLFDFTDSSGDYSIDNVPAGTYEAWTLETSAYRAASREVSVSSGETEAINFTIYYFTDPPDLNPPEWTD